MSHTPIKEMFEPLYLVEVCDDARTAQMVALFKQLDDRGQQTTLAMLAVAVKLHPKKSKEVGL